MPVPDEFTMDIVANSEGAMKRLKATIAYLNAKNNLRSLEVTAFKRITSKKNTYLKNYET